MMKRERISLAEIIIGTALALIVFSGIGYAVALAWALDAAMNLDWSGGLKLVIEQLWCGSIGCFGK